MFASLVALDGFHQVLSSQLSAILTRELRRGFALHPLSHIYTKLLFNCVETVANNALNRWLIVINDRLWANEAPTLNTAFSMTNVHAKNGEDTAFWYIQLLCYLMQLQFTIGQNEFLEFFSVFRDNCLIWMTWAFSIICVCTTTFNVSIPPRNLCFRLDWVRIWLIKSILFLNSIFPIRELCFIITRNSDISICFENFHLNNCNL